MEEIKRKACEYIGEDGKFHCPFAEIYGGGDICRACCGVGVDEDSGEVEE